MKVSELRIWQGKQPKEGIIEVLQGNEWKPLDRKQIRVVCNMEESP